jgi:energy-coupling factor transporter transmembrane protein EcfT
MPALTSEDPRQQATSHVWWRQAEAWRPHPAVFMLLWIFLTIALQSLHETALLSIGIPLTVIAFKISAVRLFTLLRRTRWIMISLLLIYGYVTPGDALLVQAGIYSPTQQGLADGVLQLCRLAFALAGLSVVLGLLPQQQLIAGIYTLAYPLRYLRLSRERIAVRLALTLHYAESALEDSAADWRGNIERMLCPPAFRQHDITMQVKPLTLRDSLLFAAGGAALVLALL